MKLAQQWPVPMVSLAQCQCTEASIFTYRAREKNITKWEPSNGCCILGNKGGGWVAPHLRLWTSGPHRRCSSENGVLITYSRVVERQYSLSRTPVNGGAEAQKFTEDIEYSSKQPTLFIASFDSICIPRDLTNEMRPYPIIVLLISCFLLHFLRPSVEWYLLRKEC
jgi:hypothetical protein